MEFDFKISGNEKDLWEEYGVPANELAEEKQYPLAINLLDKCIKKNPEVIFAKLLKATYIIQEINDTISYALDELKNDELNWPDNSFSFLKNKKKEITESIKLLNEIERDTGKDKNITKSIVLAESLLSFINTGISSYKKTAKEIKKNINKYRVYCPYCKGDKLYEVYNSETELNCVHCNKVFKVIIGVVRASKGFNTKYSGLATIRYKKIEGGEGVLNYNKKYIGYDIRQNDNICIVYSKSWLGTYSKQPKMIIHYTLGTMIDSL